MNDEQINIACSAPITAGSRAEDARIVGLGTPPVQFCANASEQFRPKLGEAYCHRCGQMVSVQFVDPISPHLRRFHDPFIDEPSKAAPNANFRSSCNELRNLTDRHGVAGGRKDREDWPVEGRRDGSGRIRQVHYQKV